MQKPKKTTKSFARVDDVRGFSRLAIDAILGATAIVEGMHANIARTPRIFGLASTQPAGGIAGLVYQSIRGVTRAVGGGIDTALAALGRVLGQAGTSDEREAVVAAVNGVLGDHLVASANPLAIAMQFRRYGKTLELSPAALAAAFPQARPQIVVMLHGLCMNDLQWRRNAHNHGDSLASAGYTPLYLHYNSGRHISENGREFAGLMEKLVANWPVAVEKIVLIGHSMGGLVARSACWYGAEAGHTWPRLLRKMIFLGSPHHGSPLEKGGHWIDILLGASPYSAALAGLGKIRSAGITDLRHGYVRDEDWLKRDQFSLRSAPAQTLALPAGVQCYVAAAVISKGGGGLGSGIGDGLVRLGSALGKHRNPARDLGIPQSRQWIGTGMNHLNLLDSLALDKQIRRWLAEPG